MATTQQEMSTIWSTLIRPNYGGDLTTLDAAIDLVSWTATLGSDVVAYMMAATFVSLRNPQRFGWNATLSAADKKTLYHEASNLYGDLSTALSAVSSALGTAYTALP